MASTTVEWGSCSQSSDHVALMVNPYLEYVNDILMDEGIDDVDDEYATPVQHTDGASAYHAIFSSLQDILAKSASDDLLHKTKGDLSPIGSRPKSGCYPPSDSQPEYIYDNTSDNYDESIFSGLQDLLVDSATDDRLHTSTGVLLDRHAPVKGRGAQTGHGHCSTMSEPHSAVDEQASSTIATELEPSFEDLKLDDVYSSLYVTELSLSTSAARKGRNINQGKHRKSSMQPAPATKGRFSQKVHRSTEVPVFVDVKGALVSCAEAVAMGDVKKANNILQELHQVGGASEHGTGLQRMAYIFSRALAARLRGTGARELEAMSREMPSTAAVLRAFKLEFEKSPYQKVVHYFANQSILKVAEGASRLHIVDYGILSGLQWPCLINALADRKEGPPLLVLTGIEFPQVGVNMMKKLAESGRRLAAYAKSHNVPFQFNGIVTSKWEDLDAESLYCSEGEVLVANCVFRLRHLGDDSSNLGSLISPRQKFFTRLHSLNPHLLVTANLNSAQNSPFFVSRFHEALNFYSNIFDKIDTLWCDHIPERHVMEKCSFHCFIMGSIACEGEERVERPETYKQWHVRITEAGFEQLPIPATISERSRAHVKQQYHKDYLIHDDGKGWMLLGWKGRPVLALSAWRPCRVSC